MKSYKFKVCYSLYRGWRGLLYTRKNITAYYRVVDSTSLIYHDGSNNVVQVCSFIKPWTVCSNMHEQACQQHCSSWPAQPCSSWQAQPCSSLSTTMFKLASSTMFKPCYLFITARHNIRNTKVSQHYCAHAQYLRKNTKENNVEKEKILLQKLH